MIVKSFKSVVCVAGVATAAIGCYMVSLQVAGERSEVAQLEARIISARQEIRSLQTELGTRGRMQQLERWNAEVLALSAPVSGQYVENEVTLARFDVRQPTLEERTRVQLASADQSAQPAPQVAAPQAAPQATALPRAQLASVRQGAAAQAEEQRPAAQPMIRRASLVEAPAAAAAPAPRPARAAAPERRRERLIDERAVEELSRAERSQGSSRRDEKDAE
jgi:hypothetical protein